MKKCFKCGEEKDFSMFYPHPQMADGYLGKCKECAKADVKARAVERAEYVKTYDKKRAREPHRVKARAEYAKKNRIAINKIQRKYAERYPLKRKAHYLAGNALRDGRLVRQPCAICGGKITQGHHNDYSKPLDVVWLCVLHHNQVHGRCLPLDPLPPKKSRWDKE